MLLRMLAVAVLNGAFFPSRSRMLRYFWEEIWRQVLSTSQCLRVSQTDKALGSPSFVRNPPNSAAPHPHPTPPIVKTDRKEQEGSTLDFL